MRYHWDTIVNTMPPEAVLSAMRDSGFETVERWTELDLFHCLRAARRRVRCPRRRCRLVHRETDADRPVSHQRPNAMVCSA
jgi:hypothetical protein